MTKLKTKTVNYIVFLDNDFVKAFSSLAEARKYARSLKIVKEVQKEGDIVKIIREVIVGITVDMFKIEKDNICKGFIEF